MSQAQPLVDTQLHDRVSETSASATAAGPLQSPAQAYAAILPNLQHLGLRVERHTFYVLTL